MHHQHRGVGPLTGPRRVKWLGAFKDLHTTILS